MVQLRSVYKRLTEIETIPQEKNNKEGIQKLIEFCGVPKDAITELLLEVEAENPFRHLFLSRWSGHYSKIVETALSLREISITQIKVEGASNFRCDFVKVEKNQVVFTFSHDASSTHWYWKDGGHYPESVVIRHPINVFFHENNTLFVTYPGFSAERSKSNSFEYSDLVDSLLRYLMEALTVDYKPFMIKKVIEVLLQRQSKRVNFTRIKSTNSEGALDFVANSNELSIENLLPSLMAKYLPTNITEELLKAALINAINDCDVKSSVLYWVEEEVSTRLSYFSFGMEFLVTNWSRKTPSFEAFTPIVEFLVFLALRFENNNANLFEFFASKTEVKTYTVTEIATEISLESKVLEKELVALVSQGILETRYRLKTDSIVLDYENIWAKDVRLLRKKFELEDHSFFDGSKMENIEVGFIFSESSKAVSFGS